MQSKKTNQGRKPLIKTKGKMKRQDKIERLERKIGKVTICNGNVYVIGHGQERKFGSVSEAHRYFFGY